MKNIFLTIIIALISIYPILGQDSLYIYKSGIINPKYAITQIDSISFNPTIDSLKLYKSGSIFNKLLIANIDSISFTSPSQQGTYKDIDGNIYTTVKIGNQIWMVENLKTTRFRNGETIPYITDGSIWVNSTSPARCDYNNDNANGQIFGHLYNWYAANDSRIIAPAGWHVPTVDEWDALKNYLIANGYNYDGTIENSKFAKALASTSYWYSSNIPGAPGNNQKLNNSTGFTAYPAGGRYGIATGDFFSLGIGSFWWTNTEFTDIEAWYKVLFYGYSFMGNYGDYKKYGYSIRCIKSDLATLITSPISSITSSTANSGGNITYDGNDPITSRGLCWDTIASPTIYKKLSLDGLGKGSFTSSMTNLLPGRIYFVRAYATNSVGTAYGNELNFTTLKTKPVLSTLVASELTYNSVKTGGIISSNGGALITARGVCWSKTHTPTIKDDLTLDGLDATQFTSVIKGLSPKTSYFIRAYATNSEGTSYGNEIEITTLATTPTITSKTAIDITSTSAVTGGEIISNGGGDVTAKGVCWSLNPNPVLNTDSTTIDGKGSGSFTSSITSLQPGTIYYIRAYATNSIGTAYGNELTFKTLSVIPTVKSAIITSITSNSALSGGEITSNGGAKVTAKGVCWSINPNPVLKTDSTTNDGSDSGTFISSIISLQPGTTYYVRAYATNSIGTAYGNELIFKTLSVLPTLATTQASEIKTNAAKCGGNISNDGGATITARGVCWSINENPTIDNNKTADGAGPGTFNSNLTGLTGGTKYYVRAYAINEKGTSYGTQVSFTTLNVPVVAATTAASLITATTAQSGGEVIADGGAAIIVRGVCWSTNENPSVTDNKTTDGTGVGSFISSISGLTAGTKYYVRAYATNEVGTTYGTQVSFSNLNSPAVSTNAITEITVNSAKSGGVISSNGGSEIIAKGVCWSESPQPVVTNNENKTSDGTGSAAFTSSITALLPATTYYLRAYATNSTGTAYGNEVTFTTLTANP